MGRDYGYFAPEAIAAVGRSASDLQGHPVLETPLNSGCFLKSFSENASMTGPASLLAVFVADDGASSPLSASEPRGRRRCTFVSMFRPG